MSTFFSAIAIFLLVLSPLFVPVAVTAAPVAISVGQCVVRALGLRRRARRTA